MRTFCFLLLFLIISCSVKQKHLTHYLSTLENIRTQPINKKDSMKIDSINQEIKAFAEKCEREKNSNCIIDGGKNSFQFAKGIDKFRMFLFEKFKVPENAKPGENLIRITIGTKNNLEKAEVIKYSDIYSKKEIENIFKQDEFNHWISASINRVKIKEQFEISIFIKIK